MGKFINFALRGYALGPKTRDRVRRNVCIYLLAVNKPLFKNAALIRASTTFARLFNETVRLLAK